MHDAWARQVAPDAGFHLLPRDAPSLAATSQTPEPETGDLVVKELQGPAVFGHREVSVVPSQHGAKPSTVLVDGRARRSSLICRSLASMPFRFVCRPMAKDRVGMVELSLSNSVIHRLSENPK